MVGLGGRSRTGFCDKTLPEESTYWVVHRQGVRTTGSRICYRGSASTVVDPTVVAELVARAVWEGAPRVATHLRRILRGVTTSVETDVAEELLLVAIVDMAPGHLTVGQRYEDAVLALLDQHGGRSSGDCAPRTCLRHGTRRHDPFDGLACDRGDGVEVAARVAPPGRAPVRTRQCARAWPSSSGRPRSRPSMIDQNREHFIGSLAGHCRPCSSAARATSIRCCCSASSANL